MPKPCAGTLGTLRTHYTVTRARAYAYAIRAYQVQVSQVSLAQMNAHRQGGEQPRLRPAIKLTGAAAARASRGGGAMKVFDDRF